MQQYKIHVHVVLNFTTIIIIQCYGVQEKHVKVDLEEIIQSWFYRIHLSTLLSYMNIESTGLRSSIQPTTRINRLNCLQFFRHYADIAQGNLCWLSKTNWGPIFAQSNGKLVARTVLTVYNLSDATYRFLFCKRQKDILQARLWQVSTRFSPSIFSLFRFGYSICGYHVFRLYSSTTILFNTYSSLS